MLEELKLLGGLGFGGVAIWLAWWVIRHHMTVTIPKMNEDFAKERDRVESKRESNHREQMDAHAVTRTALITLAQATRFEQAISEQLKREAQPKDKP